MTKEEVRFQVALSCIQGVLEAKHGIIGEIVPEIAIKESLRIADEFVKQWFGEHSKELVAEVLAKAGLKPYKDGNQWCILAGDNIQEGICGFGDTIEDALYQFLLDCMSSAKCEDGWHKTANSLPNNGRDVLAKDALGNYLIASFDGAQWFVSVYDGEDHPVLHTPPIIEWCDIPSEKQKEQKPVECCKDTLLEWAKLVLKCQEEELAKYDSPSYMKASTMGRIDAYKVLIAKLNSL